MSTALETYATALTARDPQVQLPALIAWRRMLIADKLREVERFGRSPRRTRKLYQHRRKLREYEELLAQAIA